MSYRITIEELLEELKISKFDVGQVYEAMKPIYPTEKEGKNIIIDGREITKPLAVDKKFKKDFDKHESPFKDFFKNKSKGDFLQVVEVEGKIAKCINLSLKEEIRERFYKNKYVFVSYEDLITGVVKQVKRGIKKCLEETSKEEETNK